MRPFLPHATAAAALLALTPLASATALRCPAYPERAVEPTAEPGADRGATVSRIIEEARERGDNPTATGAVLFALGPDYVPALLRIHERGETERPLGPRNRQVRPLESGDWDVLYAALGAHDWTTVEPLLTARLDDVDSADVRMHVLEVYGAVAPAASVTSLGAVAAADGCSVERDVRATFRDALIDLLERSPGAASRVPDLYADAHPALLASIVEALGTRADHQGARALVELVGAVPEADPLVLLQVAEVARSIRRPVPADLLDGLRPALDRPARGERLEAIKALGRMDDVASIPRLIELLDDEDVVVAKEARSALERISCERIGNDSESWTHWYRRAETWLADEFPSLRTDLRSGDESRTSRALLRVARYRVFRHELAADVADTLGGASSNTAIVTCSVLGHFATPECVPPLLGALDHPSLDVRRAAYDALRRATGADHGERAESWRAAGWSSPN